MGAVDIERLERKDIRLDGYDYGKPGGYYITICTKGKKSLFWQAKGKPAQDSDPSLCVGASFARPALSKYGNIVLEEMTRLSKTYPNVRLDKSVIMPNHIHMILVITKPESGRAQLAPTLPKIVQQFKGKITKRIGMPIWQKGYYDHIIRNQADYLRIWSYIDGNPSKWEEDEYFPPVMI